MFRILPAPHGIPISYKGHYYGRDGEALVPLNISKIEEIRKQNRSYDWSVKIIQNASIDDLDPLAIKKARELYTLKNQEKKDEIILWDDRVFLNKAKLTIKNQITNTAILLLGKEESEHFLSPSNARIRWILKEDQGVERDYIIKGCPLLLSVEEIYRKIRNLKYRYINTKYQTIFPEELDTYEPYTIREALNNAIAHQDYTLCGQVSVVEYDDRLIFSNRGNFIPENIQTVLQTDYPEDNYRNTFLVGAMVNLNMVDTIGSGIKKMFSYQRKRLFPLPYYDLENEKVQITIYGKLLDQNYAEILVNNTSLSLYEIEILNRVQLHKVITDEELLILRRKNLVEGRKPNIYISKTLSRKIDKKIEYTINKGFNDAYYCDLILKALKEHGKLSKQEIKSLLLKKLPDILTSTQKEYKIQNLLTKLRKQGAITNDSKGIHSHWKILKAI